MLQFTDTNNNNVVFASHNSYRLSSNTNPNDVDPQLMIEEEKKEIRFKIDQINRKNAESLIDNIIIKNENRNINIEEIDIRPYFSSLKHNRDLITHEYLKQFINNNQKISHDINLDELNNFNLCLHYLNICDLYDTVFTQYECATKKYEYENKSIKYVDLQEIGSDFIFDICVHNATYAFLFSGPDPYDEYANYKGCRIDLEKVNDIFTFTNVTLVNPIFSSTMASQLRIFTDGDYVKWKIGAICNDKRFIVRCFRNSMFAKSFIKDRILLHGHMFMSSCSFHINDIIISKNPIKTRNEIINKEIKLINDIKKIIISFL